MYVKNIDHDGGRNVISLNCKNKSETYARTPLNCQFIFK